MDNLMAQLFPADDLSETLDVQLSLCPDTLSG
jgi:hypothetical protein